MPKLSDPILKELSEELRQLTQALTAIEERLGGAPPKPKPKLAVLRGGGDDA